MASYIIKRLFFVIISLFVISIISFIIIQLPPGDFANTAVQQLGGGGIPASPELIEQLQAQYGLDKPLAQQYFIWMGKMVRGDFGYSLYYAKNVNDILRERFPYSLYLAFFSIIFVYIISIPMGIVAANKQRSPADYSLSVASFFGMSIPDFLLGLVAMYFFFKFFKISMGGFFTNEMVNAPWSFAKFVDLVKHTIVPVIVVGAASTALTFRVMRASMLDELRKPYVQVARSKGLPETKTIMKYPTRVALNPIVSTMGYILPTIISGEIIVAYVLDLPTIGPALLHGALTQDMYLIGACVMILSFLTVIGTLASDLLLVITDPRIKFQ